MLVSRRKRKENKNITVYLNNTKPTQVTQIKYLGIIMDHKFRFNEHIIYAADRCKKLIHSLSKMAKNDMGYETQGHDHHLQRSHFTITIIRCSGMD
jgi:hypothetical protein